jgi:putative ABC transport system substrate-binding protein
LPTSIALLFAIALFTAGLPAAGAEARKQVNVGVVGFMNELEAKQLEQSLGRELRARPERPPLAYRMTIIRSLAYTDAAMTSAVDALEQFRPDVVLLLSPVLTDKVLERIDKVPIVMTGAGFVTKLPWVASVARPGGRVTGFIRDPPSLAKRVELLQSFCPSLKRIGNLIGIESKTDDVFIDFLNHENERLRGRDAVIVPLYMRGLDLLESLPEVIRAERLDALVVSVSIQVRDRIDEVSAAMHALGIPHIYSVTGLVEQGAALGAQPANFDIAKTAAEYISRIAHGEAAAEIPIQISRAYDIAMHTERIKDFKGCDPRRIAKIATRFFP